MTDIQPKVVLIETSHPGNIGAVARAMKTMALRELILVRPKHFPHADATARASRADNILKNAQIFETLSQAIVKCHWVVGITARARKISSPVFSPKQLMPKMATEYQGLQVAWVFGREQHGLSNEEIDLCHEVCTIPTSSEYSSLNVAAAVQIICYEWLSTSQQFERQKIQDNSRQVASIAPADELAGLYEHIWSTLAATGFLDSTNPKPLMRKIRRIFDRTQLTHAEINILRGILKSYTK